MSERAQANLDELTPEQLASRCADRQADASHEPFCIELFRQAVSAGSQACWDHIVQTYHAQVATWIRFKARGLSADEIRDMVAGSFGRFWQYFSPAHLARCKRLGEILQYLRACATSVALDWVRSARRRHEHTFSDLGPRDPEQGLDESALATLTEITADAHDQPHTATEQTLWREDVWQCIASHIHTDLECLVADLSWSEGLKPAAIYSAHPDLFDDVGQVYATRRALLDRMKRDGRLKQLRENPPGSR